MRFKKILGNFTNFSKSNPFLLLLFILYYINIFFISAMNAYFTCRKDICGLWFAGIMVHDSFWHIALINSAFKIFPFVMPNYSGAPLQGYHFLYDFFIYLFTYSGLSGLFIWWKIMPSLFFILFASLSVSYARSISKSRLFTFFYAAFVLFGGTMSYVPRFINTGKFFDASDTFLQMNTVVLSQNVAFSFLVIIYCLILLSKEKGALKRDVIIAGCLFVTMGLKFYGGIVLFVIVFLNSLLQTKNLYGLKRLLFKLSIYSLAMIVAVVIFYNPFSSLKTGSIFVFSPLTLAHPMIESPDLYNLKSMTLARYALQNVQKFSPRLIAIEAFTIGLFLFHYVGLYLIGVVYIVYKVFIRKLTTLELSFIVSILITLIFPLLFIQKGGYINTLQFIYYGMLLMSYFAAQSCYMLVKNGNMRIKVLMVSSVILLSLPNNITNMKMPFDSPYVFSDSKLEAFDFLRRQPNGAIFSYPLSDDSHIPAFTGKQTYISDVQQLEITGIDYKKRKELYSNPSKLKFSQIPVRYVYLLKKDKMYVVISKSAIKQGMKKVFENKEIAIYEKNSS